jgi:antitoxin (DNA-binding transcriptional repressor) of toxin-antitoxin stability system
MNKSTIRIVVAIFAIAVLLVAVGFALPSSFHVEKSIEIKTPPSQVYALISDLNRWKDWTEDSSGEGKVQISSNSDDGIDYVILNDAGEQILHGSFRLSSIQGGTQVVLVTEGEFGWSPVARLSGMSQNETVAANSEKKLERLKSLAEDELGAHREELAKEKGKKRGGGGGASMSLTVPPELRNPPGHPESETDNAGDGGAGTAKSDKAK